MVSNRNRLGQLGDGIVEDHDVVAHGVGPGVAGTEHPGKGLTGAVAEAQQRMESEATFVVRSGQFLVLRVDLDEGGVDVQIDRTLALGDAGSTPHLGADLGEPGGDGAPHLRGDLVEGPVHRRVRWNLSEQVALGPEVFDVGAVLAPAGQHQRALDEDLAPVVDRGPLTRNGDAGRQVLTERHPVGKIPQCVESDMADDLVASGFHNDGTRAGSFHFVGALLVLVAGDFAIVRIPDGKGTYADTRSSGHTAP